MTDTLPRLDEPGDAELISAVRGGDVSAYGPLFERHVEAARRLARQLVGAADADDLVSDAFTKVLRVLQGGGGPDVAFRAYLLTAVRRLHVDKIRANSRLHTTDDMEMFDPGVPFKDTAVEGFESAAAAKAFASLPERWQAVLWHTEVEGQKPAEVAEILGMTPNSVSALAYRAREGLRQAFLTSHAMDVEDDACAATHQLLGGYIRGGVSKRDAGKVEKHLDECRKCMAIYLELTEVNNNLALILAPLLLGGAGAGYLATAGMATKGGFLLFLDRAKDTMSSNGPATAAAGVAVAGVVAASAVFALQAGGKDPAPSPRAGGAPPAATAAPGTPPVAPPATDEPTDEPVVEPTITPTEPAVTATPTVAPSTAPTSAPSRAPKPAPTTAPTTAPTVTPTPTATPTPTVTPLPPVDFGLTASSSPIGNSGKHDITVTVSGVTDSGYTATLSAASGATLTSSVCPLLPCAIAVGGVYTFTADVTGPSSETAIFTVTPVGAQDTNPANDSNDPPLNLAPSGGQGGGGGSNFLEPVIDLVVGVLDPLVSAP